jgi:hypothetical protein
MTRTASGSIEEIEIVQLLVQIKVARLLSFFLICHESVLSWI